MIDVDCMIRSLRLGWLQRVFNDSSATWKRYSFYLLLLYGAHRGSNQSGAEKDNRLLFREQ